MIPSFRQAVLRVQDPKIDGGPKEDNLLYQLKCIFIALAESQEQFFNPGGLCQAFKDWDGNSINVYEQMDVDEFYN